MAKKALKRKTKTAVAAKAKSARGRKPASTKSKISKGLKNYAMHISAAVKEGKVEVMRHVKEAKAALASAKKTHSKELSKLKSMLAKSKKGDISSKVAKAMKMAEKSVAAAEAEVKAYIASHDKAKHASMKLAALQKAIIQFEKTWKKENKATASAPKAAAGKRGRKPKATAAAPAKKAAVTGKKRGRKPKAAAPVSAPAATEVAAPTVEGNSAE